MASIGISLVDYTLAESAELAAEVTPVDLIDKVGAAVQQFGINRKQPFAVRGRGDLPDTIALGVSGVTISGITGGVTLVSDITEGDDDGQVNSWSVNGANYPDAS